MGRLQSTRRNRACNLGGGNSFQGVIERQTPIQERHWLELHSGNCKWSKWITSQTCSSLNSTLRSISARLHVSDTEWFPSRGIFSVMRFFNTYEAKWVEGEVNPPTHRLELTTYSTWNWVRFASTPATGACRFQKSTKSLVI